MAYVKQNAGEGLNWRPTKEWNFGVGYGYERYDWTQADATTPTRIPARVYADWKPMNWFTFRSSGYYSERRYENYDYMDYVVDVQFPQGIVGPPASTTRSFIRPLTGSCSSIIAIDGKQTLPRISPSSRALHTPTFKYQDDNYTT